MLPIVVGSGAVLAALASLAPAPTLIRAPLVLAFALLGPGAAIVPLLALRDPLGELTLAIGVSCSLDVALALGMLYAHAWSPDAGLAILVAVTLAGAVAQAVVERSRR
jgi:hypothetical protein